MTVLRKNRGGGRDDTDEQNTFENPTYVVEVPEAAVPAEVVRDDTHDDHDPLPSTALLRVATAADHGSHALARRPRFPSNLALPLNTQPPTGMATEAQLDGFRELRTRLLAMAAGVQLTQFTTLIVPMFSGSGGSFVARNLAAAFTLQDRRTAMLVDCNVDRPSQHIALRTAEGRGLFDFLDEPYAQLDGLLRQTGVPGLHLIPAGQPRSRFREYFSSAAIRTLVDALREGEYFVFLDGPPTKGSPDARILSELADFVILVVGYGKGSPEDVAQAAAMFDPAKFAGVVFNERG